MYYSCFTPLNVPENQNDLDHPYLESAIALSNESFEVLNIVFIVLSLECHYLCARCTSASHTQSLGPRLVAMLLYLYKHVHVCL